MDKYLEILPGKLLNRGYFLNNEYIKGVGIAFKYDDMLCVLKILCDNNISVLGGDVYYLESGLIEFGNGLDNWYTNYNEDERYDSYIERSLSDTKKYLDDTKLNDNFLYTAVVANEIDFYKLKKQLYTND